MAPSLTGLLLASAAHADVVHQALDTDHLAITIERVADGFENPWAVAFARWPLPGQRARRGS
ncbi:hypothetical protein DK37_11670 [Halomonas sp. SUBG004]|nr:hypothetical protein DK37_11670 [Halomonas sp. SUBG004]